MTSIQDRMPSKQEVVDKEMNEYTDEASFLTLTIGLAREAADLAGVVAEIRQRDIGVGRDQGVAIGLLLHAMHITTALCEQAAAGLDGTLQLVINRQLIEIHANLNYLCEGGRTHPDRFAAYVNDSLIAERFLAQDIDAQVNGRSGEVLPIETRMQDSIGSTTRSAGIEDLRIVPGRRNNDWPTAEVRVTKLGPTAYSAFRLSSAALHSTFTHIEKNYWLNADPAAVEMNYRAPSFRPQAFESATFHLNRAVAAYSVAYLGGVMGVLGPVLTDLEQRVRKAAAGHERFLAQQEAD